MKAHHILIAAALSACSHSVFAQWQWVDDSGRKVFSDRPPPEHIAPKNILKQPTHAARPAQPAATSASNAEDSNAASAADTPAAAPQVDADLQAQKAKQEAQQKAEEEAKRKQEEAQRKKEEAQQAKARQENCARARSTQSTIESGVRLSHTNAKGERGFMSEEQRQAELKNAQEAIKRDCKP